MAEVRRNHVLRQHLPDCLAELRRRNLALTFIEEHNDLLRLVVGHTSIRNEFQRIDNYMLNLAQFNSITGMFDKRILTSLEHDLAALVARDDIASPIDDFRISCIQRILRKRRRGLLGVVVVAHGK